ncbi:MAG: thioredoxin-disulfide reductase [Candidatus Methylacidiphilales bacterium]|nr:thioredoxin-disulfide reductase [Candidatus Methylacidiphilales bacterium]
MEQVVIIGTGCAGLTAAIYTARANLSPLVLTGVMPGGLLTTTSTVENFPGFPEGIDGYELMTRMQDQAKRFGARINFAQLDSVDFSSYPLKLTIDGDVVEARTVIIATGSSHRHLGLESETKLEKFGVTYCATCDGAWPQFRNQPLVVVGGGDSALEEATYLTRFGSKVFIVHRRDEWRASKIMRDRALANEKIVPVWDSVIDEIEDVSAGKVTAVRLRNLKTGETSLLPCAGVFIAIGHVPNTEVFKDQLDLDEHGYVKLQGGTRTNVNGVFSAGDVSDSVYRQAITAAGTGCAAAIEAERFLAALDADTGSGTGTVVVVGT